MNRWNSKNVTLATEELRVKIAGKKVALMMNTTSLDNDGRLLIDLIVAEKWAEILTRIRKSTCQLFSLHGELNEGCVVAI